MMKHHSWQLLALVGAHAVGISYAFVGVEPYPIRLALVLAFTVGVINLPVLLWIYHLGINGEMSDSFRCVGYSLVWKSLVLFGTPVAFYLWTGIDVMTYVILLFFLLFSLSFLAIYMAYSVDVSASNEA